jgi:hypothetical protein
MTDKHDGVLFAHRFDFANSRKRPDLPRFILQYDLDNDPFELFATEKELRARITGSGCSCLLLK